MEKLSHSEGRWSTMTLEQVLSVANQLSEVDKLRLIRQLMIGIEPTHLTESKQSRISSLGILAHLGTAPSEKDIDNMRQEMCANFGESL
jgi:hypothetical protein